MRTPGAQASGSISAPASRVLGRRRSGGLHGAPPRRTKVGSRSETPLRPACRRRNAGASDAAGDLLRRRPSAGALRPCPTLRRCCSSSREWSRSDAGAPEGSNPRPPGTKPARAARHGFGIARGFLSGRTEPVFVSRRVRAGPRVSCSGTRGAVRFSPRAADRSRRAWQLKHEANCETAADVAPRRLRRLRSAPRSRECVGGPGRNG
jgi:hypothetical protein